jgi:ABC-type multidrug transport system ATPase subunit
VAAVCERFGRVQALAVMDLVAERSSVPALPGTCKTTLVRMLTTLLAPDSGRTTVADRRKG